jgi:predicted ATPase
MYLRIKNFKCFHDAEIPLRKLSVFVGSNGNGKSSAIQSLLFMRQTIEHCAQWENGQYNLTELNGLNVPLNDGYCLSLGNSDYVVPVDADVRDTITMCLAADANRMLSVAYDINTGRELWLTPKAPLINSFPDNPLYFQEFYYLNAERLGPRLAQSMKFYDYPNVGFQGEYTAQMIADMNYNFVAEDVRTNEEFLTGSRFEHHINAWLQFILPGVAISSHYDDRTHTARIAVQNSYSKGTPIVPTNTGFGISYVLPVIVTGLLAQKERFFIVENPEAHLHPSAQSRIGQFLAIVASAGINVVIETHSDHVINGIQIAAAEQKISPEDVVINFFAHDDSGIQPSVTPIGVREKGELTHWPKGFFDQSQLDYSYLVKLRRNV